MTKDERQASLPRKQEPRARTRRPGRDGPGTQAGPGPRRSRGKSRRESSGPRRAAAVGAALLLCASAVSVWGVPPARASHTLDQPANFSVSVTEGTAKATWDAVQGADSYAVGHSPVGQVARGDAVEATVSGTSHTFTGLKIGTIYQFSLVAVSSGGHSQSESGLRVRVIPAYETTLMAADLSSSLAGCDASVTGKTCATTSVMADNAITHGGSDHTISKLTFSTGGDVVLQFAAAMPREFLDLRLWIGDTYYDFGEATLSGGNTGSETTATWTSGQGRSDALEGAMDIRLSAAPPHGSTLTVLQVDTGVVGCGGSGTAQCDDALTNLGFLSGDIHSQRVARLDYGIDDIVVDTAKILKVDVTPAWGSTGRNNFAGWALVVDREKQFLFADATSDTDFELVWANSGLSWTANQKVHLNWHPAWPTRTGLVVDASGRANDVVVDGGGVVHVLESAGDVGGAQTLDRPIPDAYYDGAYTWPPTEAELPYAEVGDSVVAGAAVADRAVDYVHDGTPGDGFARGSTRSSSASLVAITDDSDAEPVEAFGLQPGFSDHFGSVPDGAVTQFRVYDDDARAAPANLAATRPGSGQLGLSWDDVTGGVSHWEVQHKTTAAADQAATTAGNANTGWVSQTVASGTLTATLSGLAIGVGHDVRVRGNLLHKIFEPDVRVNGAWSSVVSATPDAPPGVPRGVAAEAGNTRVSVSWAAPAAGGAASGYDVHYTSSTMAAADAAAGSDAATEWVAVTRASATALTETVTGLTNQTQYRFRVRARNAIGSSGWAERSATPEAKPEVTLAVAPSSVEEGAKVTVTVSVSRALGTALRVPLSVSGTGATPAEPDDYTAPAAVTIPAGQMSATGTIATDEDDDASDETFTVALGMLPSGSGAVRGSPAEATVTVTDPDLPTLRIAAAPGRVEEGKPVTVIVTLSDPLAADLVVPLTFSGFGSQPAEPDDYSTLASVTIPQGQLSADGTITTSTDTDTDIDRFAVAIDAAMMPELGSTVEQISRESVDAVVTICDAVVPDCDAADPPQRTTPGPPPGGGSPGGSGSGPARKPSEERDATRVAGADRYATSLDAARRTAALSDGKLAAVVLAGGRSWTDALAAGPLAASLDGAVLLSAPDGLSDDAKAFLTQAAVSEIIAVGSAEHITDAALEALADVDSDIERIGGGSPAATAAAVARRTGRPQTLGPLLGRTAVVATDAAFADALAAGPLAASGPHPILLTGADALHPDAAAYLAAHVDHVIVMGGTAAISSAVEEQIRAIPQASRSGERPMALTRIAGADRYDTAVKLARWITTSTALEGRVCFTTDLVGVATGIDPADAAASAPLLARKCAPLVLTRPDAMPTVTASYLRRAQKLLVFGGTKAITNTALRPWTHP